jgi:hypothetical protein
MAQSEGLMSETLLVALIAPSEDATPQKCERGMQDLA